MTDDERSPSRRERRAQEAREAARPAEDTDALSLGPISESIPTHSPDGRVLSRRERRRLERSRQPMETWTAEEEMIATGQIPAMTPERIAEQEKIAREKAEAAQQEAEAASAELEGVVGRAQSVTSAPYAAAAPDSGAAPDFGHEAAPRGGAPVHEAPSPSPPASPPERASLIAAVASDNVPPTHEPHHAPEPHQASSPQAGAPHEQWAHQQSAPPTESTPAPTWSAPPAQEPVSTQSVPAPAATTFTPPVSAPSVHEQPRTQFSPGPDVSTSVPAAAASAPAAAPSAPVPGMPPGMSPEMFAELFPPGSLQRRLMEQQAASEAAEQQQVEDPAAEIRRLTQEAVAGIDAAGARSAREPKSAVSAASSPGPAASESSPWLASGDINPGVDSAASAASAPATAFAAEPTVAPFTSSAPQPTFASEQPAPWGSPAPSSQGQTGYSTTPQAAPAFGTYSDESAAPAQHGRLEEAPFDAIIGDRPETAALDEAAAGTAEINRPTFGDVVGGDTQGGQEFSQAPHHAAFETVPEPLAGAQGVTPVSPAVSPWGEHPLAKVDRDAPELPQMPPTQGVPQPDLSGIGSPSHRGAPEHFNDIQPVPTGQIEVPKRERPALEEVDAPRHFKWAHLAVFGAVALLLGVVVWNLS